MAFGHCKVPVESESPQPRSELLAWIDDNYNGDPGTRDFGEDRLDQFWAHSFTDLAVPGYLCEIQGAVLEVMVRNKHGNDTLNVGCINSPNDSWESKRLTDLGVQVGQKKKITVDLRNVNGTNLLGVIMSNGFLDVAVQDDSTVYCVKLSLRCRCITIPQGWHLPFDKAAQNVLRYQFEEGNLERESCGILDWKELDMRIFDSMKENVRRPFTEVSEITGVFSSTVKEHFYKHVLPRCNVAHYFFPKGYDFYMKNLIRIHTKCEKSIINALKCLPCTTYVYPLEKGLIITLFHENINITMTFIEKMEENGVIEHYTLFTPLWYDHI